MRKYLLLMSITVLFFACKTSAPSASISRTAQSGIKGNWQIKNVVYPGSDYLKVTSFQIADSKCFIGSIWNFVSNNNKGTMRLNQPDCPVFSSPIVWSIDKDGKFGLKIVQPGIKSKNVTQGYLLRIANQTNTSFQLIDIINVGGQNQDIVYQFEKIN